MFYHIHPSTAKCTQVCFHLCYIQFTKPQVTDEVIIDPKVSGQYSMRLNYMTSPASW